VGAQLYELDHPTDLQKQILEIAEEHLAWSEVPGTSWLRRRNELIALARKDMAAAPIHTLPAKD
jgi:hypothetical protein